MRGAALVLRSRIASYAGKHFSSHLEELISNEFWQCPTLRLEAWRSRSLLRLVLLWYFLWGWIESHWLVPRTFSNLGFNWRPGLDYRGTSHTCACWRDLSGPNAYLGWYVYIRHGGYAWGVISRRLFYSTHRFLFSFSFFFLTLSETLDSRPGLDPSGSSSRDIYTTFLQRLAECERNQWKS